MFMFKKSPSELGAHQLTPIPTFTGVTKVIFVIGDVAKVRVSPVSLVTLTFFFITATLFLLILILLISQGQGLTTIATVTFIFLQLEEMV
jgi:hypothetical protein